MINDNNFFLSNYFKQHKKCEIKISFYGLFLSSKYEISLKTQP